MTAGDPRPIKIVLEVKGVETEYRVRQKPGYVLIYRRARRGPHYRDYLIWDSRGRAPKIGSITAQVLVMASRYATLDLSKRGRG